MEDLVAGRFALRGTLGRGGMGVVYRALDRDRDTEVALKQLAGLTAAHVLRFKSEFRALCDVRHPNLVQLGELFESRGSWYLTMELVDGVSFLEWVRTDADAGEVISDDADRTAVDAPGSVVQREALVRERHLARRLDRPGCEITKLRAALAQLARGLSALHAAGKVHRDVKPSNILVDTHGRVVLLDFGVVAELQQVPDKAIVGTYEYMAPEQARGDAVGPAADWYAVGVLVFKALTGRLPFAGVADEVSALKQHVRAPEAHELAGGIPDDLDRLCARLLERDWRQRPTEAEILEVLDDPASAGIAPVFVGRAAELGALDAALAASRKELACVIVEGESGVGKTALVQQFIERARSADPDLVVLRGRCHQRERVPFNAVDGVVDDLARFLISRRGEGVARVVPDGLVHLLAVFPALRAVPMLANVANTGLLPKLDVRGRASIALRDLLTALARRHPVVVAIDDLQWADTDSGLLLDELVRTGVAPAICLVATKRPGEGHRLVQRLGRVSTDLRRLELGGLAPRDAEQLVRLVGDAAMSDARAKKIVDDSHGHPMFLRELASSERDGQPVVTAAMPALEEAIWMRAAVLDPGCQDLLAAIAVAGERIPRKLAYATAGLDVHDGEHHLATLVREHLARGLGARAQDDVEPFHDRVREAVCAQLSAERLAALHRTLADGLAAIGAPAGALLASVEGSGDRVRTVELCIAAAEDALRTFAFGRAAELLRRALDGGGHDDARRGALLVQLADALANDGRSADAAVCFLEAAALEPVDSPRHLDLLRRAAERFLMSGRLEQGYATARAVLARVDMTLPASRMRTIAGILWNQIRTRGRALAFSHKPGDDHRAHRRLGALQADVCWSMGAGLAMVDSLLGAYFSGRAARLALAHGSPLQIARSLSAAAIGAAFVGRNARANLLVDTAVRAATADGSPLAMWYPRLARVGLEFLVDNDFQRCGRNARSLEGDWYAAGQGPAWETDVAMHFALASQQMMGEYKELARRTVAQIQEAHRKGDLFQEVTLRVRFVVPYLLDGRAAEGDEDVRDAMTSWLPTSDNFGNQRAWALWSRTRLMIYMGAFDHLERELADEWRRMHRSLFGHIAVLKLEWCHCYATFLLGCALAEKKRGNARRYTALCSAAARVGDKLAKINYPAMPAALGFIRTAVAFARDAADKLEVARAAVAASRACRLHVFLSPLERRLGEALGGTEGAELVARADADLRAQGWVDPERGAEIVSPTGRFS